MLGYFRWMRKDMEQNQVLFARKLRVSILALGGNAGSAPGILKTMQPLGEDVRGGVVANSGHYIPEEQPGALADELLKFAGSLEHAS